MADDIGAFTPDPPEPLPEGTSAFVPDEPDVSAMKSHVETNIKAAVSEKKPEGQGFVKKDLPVPRQAHGLKEALEAGWKSSFSGLMMDGGMPDVVLPEDASRAMKLASTISGLAGDLPAMAAGMVAGAEVAGPVGKTAGGFAVPAAMRKILVDHYERGDIQNAADFSDRVVGTAWEALKGAGTGIATELGGGLAGQAGGVVGKLVGEVAAMTTVSKGLEGKLPEWDDFINGAIVIGAVHTTGAAVDYLPKKLGEIYKQTGVKPVDAVDQIMKDPILKSQVLSTNIEGQHIDVPSSEEQAAKGLPMFTEKDLMENPQKVIDSNPPPEPKVKEPALSESEQKILSKIGPETKPQGKSLSENIHQFYTDRFDFLHQWKQAIDESGGEQDASKNAYVLARTMGAYTDKVRNFYEEGTYDFSTRKVNGEGLLSIINDAKEVGGGSLDKLNAFAMSKRYVELEGRGIDQGADMDAAKQVVKDNEKTMGPIQRRLVEFRERSLKYYADSGMLSKEKYDKFLDMNKEHVPLQKILEPDPLTGKPPAAGKVIKAIGDSDLSVKNPVLQTFKDVDFLIKEAELNRTRSAFIDTMLEGEGAGDHLAVANKKAGGSGEYFENRKTGDNEMHRFVDGEKEIYKGQPGLIEAAKRLEGNQTSLGMFTKLAKPFANAVRVGNIADPGFALRHFWRAQMFAGLTSKTGMIPFLHPALELGSFFKKDASYRQWLFDGGAQGSLEPMGKKYIDSKVLELDKDAPVLNQAVNLAKSAFQMTHAFVMLSDNLTRFAEYKRSLPPDVTSATQQQRMQAAFNSREVTPDYSRIGAQMSAITAQTAFYNADLQGVDRAARAFKEDPVGSTYKALAMYTVPALLTWYATHDQDWYKGLQHWEKDLYLNFRPSWWRETKDVNEFHTFYDQQRRLDKDGKMFVQDGAILKTPQTFDVGLIFGSGPMRVLDAYYDHDPGAIKDFLKDVAGKIPGLPVPDVLRPVVEHIANYNFFTHSPIIPDSKRSLTPELEYTPYTSETAKALGKMVRFVPGLSHIGPPGKDARNATMDNPMIIDHYIKALGGTLGQYIVATADKALIASGVAQDPIKPASHLSDMPFAKELFAREVGLGDQRIASFMERTRTSDDVQKSFETLMKQGNVKEAMALREKYRDTGPALDGYKKAIDNISSAVQKISQIKQIEPVQKRQLMDGLYLQAIKAAKSGEALLDAMDKRAETMNKGQ